MEEKQNGTVILINKKQEQMHIIFEENNVSFVHYDKNGLLSHFNFDTEDARLDITNALKHFI